jgi:hypothetical integral membrane protein (TIGR02206 family)
MLISALSPGAYWAVVLPALGGGVIVALVARRRPGQWSDIVVRVLGVMLAWVAVSFIAADMVAGTFTARSDLPVALCDAALVVAALASWWPATVLVELTWFWGLAGTLQGLLTPDLDVGPTHLAFWQYILGHAGIVAVAMLLVVGMRREPRRGAVPRVFAISVVYTAFVAIVDAATGANYMFLRQPPGEWTLLRVMGPWPWYIATAAAVALVLFTVLDLPFRLRRSSRGGGSRRGGQPSVGGPSAHAGLTRRVHLRAHARAAD